MLNNYSKNKKRNILLNYTFFIFIVTISLVLLFFYKYSDISTQYKDKLDRINSENSFLLHNEFEGIKSDIDYLSSHSIQALLLTENTVLKDRMKKDFYNYVKTKNKYDQLRIIDKNGQEIIRIDKKTTLPIVIKDAKLQNKRDRYYFKDALALKPNDIYISQLDLNKEHGEIELPIKPMIRFVKPIFDEKFQFQGVIVLNYKADNFLLKLQKNAKKNNLEMTIVNKKGNIIHHKNELYNWSFMYKKSKVDFLNQVNPSLWNNIIKHQEGLFTNDEGIFTIQVYFPYKLLLNDSDNILSDYDKKWYIVLSKDSNEIRNLVFDEMYEVIPITIFFFLFGLIAIWKLTQYRESLYKEEEKTRIARITFSNTAQGIMICDKQNRIIEINKAFTQITGYVFSELIGKNPRYLKSGKVTKDVYKKLWTELLVNGVWEGVLWNKKKNGAMYPCLLKINIFKDEKGKLKNYIAVFSDITEQMDIQKNLESKNKEITLSKEKIQVAMEELKSAQSQVIHSEKMAALGQLIAGVAHEINTPLGAINSSATNISNALDNTIINTLHLIKILPLDLKAIFLNIISNDLHQKNTIDFENQRKIKKELIILLNKEDIEHTRRVADMIVSSNLVDKINKLLPLLKSKHVKEIMEAINKINSISLNTKNIELAVSRASRIVKALKNFSHQDIGDEMVYGKVSEGIETVLVVYYSQMKREVKILKDYGNFSALFCHFDELNQVWTNIIQNGIQAMAYKGTMSIKIYEDNIYQIVEISDTGQGMTEEVKSRIFEPFYTTKAIGEGTGLGLDIVKKIIDKHKGKIEVESCVGEGTTFRVYIDKNLQRFEDE